MVTKARTLGSAVSAGGVIQRDGAIKSYSTVNELPLSGNTIGDTAYISNFSRLYMWTGAGWFSIALINTNPSFDSGGTPEASYILDSAAGDPIVIQLSANDPEEVPVQWSYVASDSAQYFADITNDSSVFTITAKDTATIQQYDSAGGTFSITFKASDGVNLATALSEFTILFVMPIPSIETAVFEKSVAITARGISFNNDQSTMYLARYTGGTPAWVISSYSLSTPGDIQNNTKTYDLTLAKATNEVWEPQDPYGLSFSGDGTKFLLFTYPGGADRIYQYNLSTPWDLSTATYFSYYDLPASFFGGYVTPDFTSYFVVDTGRNLSKYSISNNNINTTAIIPGQVFDLDPANQKSFEDVFFSPDGLKMYIIQITDNTILEYTLLNPYEISPAPTLTGTLSTVSENSRYFDLYLTAQKLYAGGSTPAIVAQYSLG